MILDRILEEKRREVERLRPRASELADRANAAPPPRDFAAALRAGDRLAVIAEFKRRSPSVGPIAPDAKVDEMAAAYARHGATALSILTDGPHFGGSLEELATARAACDLPILRKDFLLEPVQAAEARAAGADALLLIVRTLSGDALGELLAAASELGMAALVEVHDEPELERALDVGAEVIGVNARNLDTFQVDLPRALELLARVPDDRTAVAESGIQGRADAGIAARAGADAVLVGGWLMARGPEGAAELAGLNRRPRDTSSRSGGG